VNGEVDFTTGDNGIATIAGLYVGKNGDSQTRDYCVVETVPPAGYVIDETPRLIRVAPGITADLELEFENQLRPGPDLPMTGGMGTAVFGGTGLALVVVAVAAGLSIRRKQTAK
jgi:LPXTG-motif cell wall-anchored protein